MYADLVARGARADRRAAAELLQGRDLRSASPTTSSALYSPRADVTIVRDKRLRRAAHLRRHARRRDVRHRLRDRRGPAVLHRRAAPRRPRRSCRASPAARPATARSTTSSGPTAPYNEADLPGRSTSSTQLYGADGAQVAGRRRATTSPGINAYIAEARARPARRCRASTPRSASRRGRTTGSRRTSSRPRRWSAGSSARAAATSSARRSCCRRCRSGSARERGTAAVARLRRASRTRRRRRPITRQALPLPGAAQARRRGRRGAARPGTLQGPVRRRSLGERHARASPALGAAPAACRRGFAAEDVQRAGRRRASSQSGHPLAVFGPQAGYFAPADPHGAGRPRPAAARHRRPRRRLPRHEPLRPARPRARLRLERDLGRPGHHRHVRRRRSCGGDRRALRVPRPVPGDGEAQRDEHLDAERRRPDAAGHARRCAA